MAENGYSDSMKQQTKLAWQYLQKAGPLITYRKLVPVSEAKIAEYEQVWDKIVPPDYRYWLTTYGSGRIEFLEGDLEVVSIYELKESYGRDISPDDPDECWKRIYIGCSFAPVTLCLDSTIIDEHGCAPVILTGEYDNKVKKVLASSWPLYVIKRIVEIASALKECGETRLFTAEQVLAIEELAGLDMGAIDDEVENAFERAAAHNCAESGDSAGGVNCAETIISMLTFINEGCERRKGQGRFSELMTTIKRLFGKEDAFTSAVQAVEKRIEQGYSSLAGNCYFLRHEIEPRHAIGLKALLSHERRELREIAEEGLQRLSSGEAGRRAS